MEDGQQVPALGERHIGKHADMASTIEREFDGTESQVEKSGTGMHAEVKNGRRPPTGLLACAALCGFDVDWQTAHPLQPGQDYQLCVGKPAWH